jgi:lipopolysaccharide biosynthesis regulator YciM
VMPGLWIADGQTTVDTDLVDIDQVLIAIELATVHWLTIDTLNRKLFTRLTKLYDDSAGRSDTLETVYLQAVEAAGTVTAVEMLLEDQRQCLPTTARTIYSAYAEQWDLAGLRAALSRRASDIVDHDARRVDYLHAKQAQLTSDLLLVLTLATLIPAVLAVTDFVTNGEALDVHDGARVVVLVVTAVVVLAVILALRRMRAALPKATPRNATKGSASRD